jgi:hypothetical protein
VAIRDITMVSYLRWLRRAERSVAGVLAVAVAALLICASGFAVSEITVLSTIQAVHVQRPAVIHLDAGTYDISQDIGDQDFPDDSTEVTITGPGGQVPGRTIPQVLALDDGAGMFLGELDCYPIVSFTIPQAGPYKITSKDQGGMSAAWISEPWADVIRQVLPWIAGLVVALLAIALFLIIPASRWRLMKRTASANASRPRGSGGQG